MNALVHYNAYLDFGDEPYDSTNMRRKPASHNLGICLQCLHLLKYLTVAQLKILHLPIYTLLQ